jgi:predicted RNase H-like nuclease
MSSPARAGVELAGQLAQRSWTYHDGSAGPPDAGRHFSECYPYTTLVGAPELGYAHERPQYKRRPRTVPATQWRDVRAANCDELVRRLVSLRDADPPLVLDTHPTARELVHQCSPPGDAAYKHREDGIDALICAWTALLWLRHGLTRCQVLGAEPSGHDSPLATIIAPAVPAQRRA